MTKLDLEQIKDCIKDWAGLTLATAKHSKGNKPSHGCVRFVVLVPV